MIRLLSTDFDGTLVDYETTPQVSQTLFDTLERLQGCGVHWAVNTGRDLGFALDGLREHQFPVEPDYILTNEREIFHRDPEGQWRDYGDWNRRCVLAHERLFQTEQPLFQEMMRFVKDETEAEPIYENNRPVGLKARDDGEMDRVVAHIHSTRKPGSLFDYQRNTVFLRFCHADYSKGVALGELCRLTRITPAETFAAGDNHNDLSMLDGRFARWPAAPCNAIDEVKQAVQRAGGYVAKARCGDGVVEALRYFKGERQLLPAGA